VRTLLPSARSGENVRDLAEAPAVVEVSRPGFTQKGCVALVRVVVRQPNAEARQEWYALERGSDGWRLKSYDAEFMRE